MSVIASVISNDNVLPLVEIFFTIFLLPDVSLIVKFSLLYVLFSTSSDIDKFNFLTVSSTVYDLLSNFGIFTS